MCQNSIGKTDKFKKEKSTEHRKSLNYKRLEVGTVLLAAYPVLMVFSWHLLFISIFGSRWAFHRGTESQSGRGWKGPLDNI